MNSALTEIPNRILNLAMGALTQELRGQDIN
jgi:hypothetical protein